MDKVKVCLWRNTSPDIRTGDYVNVTDVVINNYKNEVSLNSTFTSKLTKVEQPSTKSQVTVVGASMQDDTTELLLNDDTVRVLPTLVLQQALPYGTGNAGMYFADMRECEVEIETKGSDILSLKFV